MYKISGEKLKQRRRQLGMSQEELAKKVGISKVSICWYENGERTPKYEVFIKLAEELDLSLDELSGREVGIVSEKGVPYSVKLAKKDIEIINELKNHPNLYKNLYNDPIRTTKLIDKKLK